MQCRLSLALIGVRAPKDHGVRCARCGCLHALPPSALIRLLVFFQFQGIWEEALRGLRGAKRWVFIGYSLPAADFELRHMLKTAQLAGQNSRALQIDVVLYKDSAAQRRFKEFFGDKLGAVHTAGFESWFAKEFGVAVP